MGHMWHYKAKLGRCKMVTGNQVRIARFALRWSVQELSERTGVPTRTIKRIEAENGVPSSSASVLQAIRNVLETAGIEFVGTPTDRPGVRIGNPLE